MADKNKSLKLHFAKYNLEPEAKFLTDEETIKRMLADIEASSPYLYAPIRRDERTNIYYDTKNYDLYARGLESRGRRFDDSEFRHDVKTPNGAKHGRIGPDAHGIFMRREFNIVSGHRKPSLHDFSGAGLGKALEDIEDEKVKAKVKGYFERSRIMCMPSEGTQVEIAFEHGYYQTLNNRRRSDDMCIVEIELKKGRMADLVKFADVLRERYGLKVCVKTKGEMGLEWARQFLDEKHQKKFDEADAERRHKYTPLRRQFG